MRIQLIDEVTKPIDEYIGKATEFLAFPENSAYIPIKIDSGNFHTLDFFHSSSDLIAVDGGNAEILTVPTFSLHFIRAVAIYYKENKRSKTSVEEFFCFVSTEEKHGKIHYKVNIIGNSILENDLHFDSEFKTLDGEVIKLEPSQIPPMIRRYAEIKIASKISAAQKTSIIIDGSIKAKTYGELSLIKKLLDSAKEKNLSVGFLSKTCSLLTKNASSLVSALQETGPKGSWYYYPIFEINDKNYLGEMYFVKLHSKSKYCFKLELSKEANAENFINALAVNSSDPIFYGYPYSLIEADKIARISNSEKEYIKNLFLAKLKNKDKLRHLLSSMDAHHILDKISY